MLNKTHKPLVAMMAGGTGGHIFPGLAVAKCLCERGVNIFWLGARKSMESELIPQQGYEFEPINISGIRGKGILGWLMAPMKVSIAFWHILCIFIKRRPSLVVGMGGFVAGPGGLAAYVANIPLLIHEQNAIAGLTNRLLAPLSERVLTGFPDVLVSKRSRYVGNPVRFQLLKDELVNVTNNGNDRLRLLVIGGSLGADIFNQVVPSALALIDQSLRPQVKQQCGKNKSGRVIANAKLQGVTIDCFDFNTEIEALYQWANLILCRAGAMTVAEIALLGKASIMVPFPHAVDNHQTANAQFLNDSDATILIPQETFNAESLAKTIENLSKDKEQIERIASNASQMAIPNSEQIITNICFEVGRL